MHERTEAMYMSSGVPGPALSMLLGCVLGRGLHADHVMAG